jgi:hypothetical protein
LPFAARQKGRVPALQAIHLNIEQQWRAARSHAMEL